jgi:hypothetical protein
MHNQKLKIFMSRNSKLNRLQVYLRSQQNKTVNKNKFPPHETDGNKSEKISVIINSFLTAFTVVAIYFTWQANDTSQQALTHIIQKDKSDSAKQVAKDRNDSIKDADNRENIKKTLAISQQNADASKSQADASNLSLAEQIKAMKQENDRFEKENAPIITFRNFSGYSLFPNKKISIISHIYNIGKQGGLLYEYANKVIISDSISYKSFYYKKEDIHRSNFYMSKDSLNRFEVLSDSVVSGKDIIDAMDNKKAVYLYGFLKYSNPLSGKKKMTKYCIKIDFPSNKSYNLFSYTNEYNSIIDIDK